MKRVVLVCMMSMACSLFANAEGWGNRWGFDFRYGFQKIENTTAGTVYDAGESFGASINFKQIQFHRKPLGGLVYLGLDLGLYGDVASYEMAPVEGDYQRGSSLLEGAISSLVVGQNDLVGVDFGAQIGPYVKVAPLAARGNTDFRVSAYFHKAPSLSVAMSETYAVAFNPFSSFGALVGWKFVSIGYELRTGARDYRIVDPDEIELESFEGLKSLKSLKESCEINHLKSTTNCIFLRLSF